MNPSSSSPLPRSIMKNPTTTNLKQSVSYSDRRCSQDITQSRSSYTGKKRRSVQFHSNCQLIPIQDSDFELEEPQMSEILYVKHCFKTYGVRASNRSWISCLVVCERGQLKLFKARSRDTQYTVDVSNLNNQLGTLSLQHSLARPLPQEHHSTKRPYLIQLDLPNGSMYMIQLASATHIGNWVGVLNYWAARETAPPNEFPTFQIDTKRGKLSTKISTSSLFNRFLGNTSPQSGFLGNWSPPLPPLIRSTLNARDQLEVLVQYHQMIYAQYKEYQPPSHKQQVSKESESMQFYLHYLTFELNRFEVYIKTLVDFIQFQLSYNTNQNYEYTNKIIEAGGYPRPTDEPYSTCDPSLPLNCLDSVTCLQTLQRPSSIASSTTLNLGPQATNAQLISLHYPSPNNRLVEKHRKSWSLAQRLSPITKLKSLNLIKPQH